VSHEVGKCPICGKQFSTKGTANRHLKEVHKGQKRGKIQNSNDNIVGRNSLEALFR